MHTPEVRAELDALEKDALRVEGEAKRLIELNPARAESYKQQLAATLFVIKGQTALAHRDKL